MTVTIILFLIFVFLFARQVKIDRDYYAEQFRLGEKHALQEMEKYLKGKEIK